MKPILGTEAIASGALTRSALRWHYTAIYPNVYLPKGTTPDCLINAEAAWLWSGRAGIIAGRTAAALYAWPGTAEYSPVELIANNTRHPPGLTIHNERIAADEITTTVGLPVTTPARTALDLARRLPRDEAVAHLDVLAAKTGVTMDDIWTLAARYPGARGIAAANMAIARMNAGATSPRETEVRMMLSDAGLSPPATAIRVADDRWETVIAMGWPDVKVGVDCNADDVRDFPHQAVMKADLLQRHNWFHIMVLPHHRRAETVIRVRNAVLARRRADWAALTSGTGA